MKYAFILVATLFMVGASAQTVDSTQVARHPLIRQADSLMSSYQFAKALTLLDAVRDSLDTGILLRIGQCNFRLGLSRAAIQPYERVLKMDSTNLAALNQLGQLFARDGDFTNALYCYLRLVNLDSTNSYYYKQSALMAAKAENKMMAMPLYEKALYYNPSDAESSLALGTILMELGRFDQVDSLVGKGLEQDPEYKPLILLKAKSAFEQDKYSEVITTINALVATTDTVAVYARLLGASYFQLHDFTKVTSCMNFLVNQRRGNAKVTQRIKRIVG